MPIDHKQHKLCGLCTKCHKPAIEGRTKCASHLRRDSHAAVARYTRRLIAGNCPCGQPLFLKSRCFECALREKARHYNTSKEFLRRLWASQDGKCAVTGEVLSNMVSASLDHDHRTNEIRGYVTQHVNLLLKAVDSGLLDDLLRYQQNPPSKKVK
jgi:Recombination endonuclease VII